MTKLTQAQVDAFRKHPGTFPEVFQAVFDAGAASVKESLPTAPAFRDTAVNRSRQLSPTQQRVFDFMRSFFEKNDQLPPMHAIAENFGWRSANTVVGILDRLEHYGLIERNAVGKYRFKRGAS